MCKDANGQIVKPIGVKIYTYNGQRLVYSIFINITMHLSKVVVNLSTFIVPSRSLRDAP